jgi:hypothetical protein
MIFEDPKGGVCDGTGGWGIIMSAPLVREIPELSYISALSMEADILPNVFTDDGAAGADPPPSDTMPYIPLCEEVPCEFLNTALKVE